MSFNERDYTGDAIIKQLGLIELHGKDGSATKAGCACIETKHLYLLEGLSEEEVGFAVTEKEKQFYIQLSDLARLIRKHIVDEDYDLHGVMRSVQKPFHPLPLHGNPRTRAFLPHNLTECEKANADVRHKLKSCIKETELKCCGVHTTHYDECACNPVAVCRVSIPCPS